MVALTKKKKEGRSLHDGCSPNLVPKASQLSKAIASKEGTIDVHEICLSTISILLAAKYDDGA
jgi:hypothetical protein